MADFDRRFRYSEPLERDAIPTWWPALLSLWTPSGTAAGEHGLRLAVRNGSLNFYRRGQSVAQVEARGADLSWHIHAKYVDPTAASDRYLRIGRDRAFEGMAQLKQWIANTERSQIEKAAVDEIVGVDEDVIDLEMGLPAFKEKKEERQRASAPRIDLVALQPVTEGLSRIVFWEVKLEADGRIRARGNLPQEGGILEQIQTYREFLKDPARKKQVEAAYTDCAIQLKRLWELAGGAGHKKLGEQILQVADGVRRLEVDPEPRLLVVLPPEPMQGERGRVWPGHLKKLQEAGLQVRTMTAGGRNRLRDL